MKDTFVYPHGGNLYINLTNKCCNDCTFCIRRSGDGVDGYDLWLGREPSADEVIKAAAGYAPDSYGEAVFCGYGEPVIKLDVMLEVCDYFHSIGKKTRLNTNGLGNLIFGKDITGLLAGKIDTVSVSLNDSSAEEYQKVSNSRFGIRAYSALIEFTRLCVEKGITAFMTVVDVIPQQHIEECKKIAASVGAALKVRKFITDNKNYK